ncbi:YciI family protein [Nocardioides sp. HB32]
MRYITFVKMTEDLGDPPPALVEAMGTELAQSFADGTMIEAGGLAGMRDSTEIHLRGGTITQSDGPYAEGKEVAGGYAITEVRSHDEAVENARRVLELHLAHWPGWEGSVEIRQMFSSPG